MIEVILWQFYIICTVPPVFKMHFMLPAEVAMRAFPESWRFHSPAPLFEVQ